MRPADGASGLPFRGGRGSLRRMTFDAASLIAPLRAALAATPAGVTLDDRRAALMRLRAEVRAREGALRAAMAADFGKGATEVDLTELVPLHQEIGQALRRMRGWARGRRLGSGLLLAGTFARVVPEPRGLCLILGPSNYPFMLALGPLVSAVAAGNRVVVKPSELTPRTSAVVAEVVRAAFAPDHVAVVEGGVEVAEALLACRWDHIFFTGSTGVGRKVMAAAVPHLASLTLELGGKSPVIVGPGADVARAARLIAWGKLTNGGQVCVAPDHLWVHRSVEGPLVAALAREMAAMEGDAAGSITPRHGQRMAALEADALEKGARVAFRGKGGPGRHPALLLTGVTPEMQVMREEIFGPILPVRAFDDLGAVIAAVNAGEKPLTLYVFERDAGFVERVRAETRSGSLAVNLTMAHFAHPEMPFGGVGESGMGMAHGKAGFLAFSHEKPVVVNRFAVLGLVMPPVTARVRKVAALVLGLARR